MLYTLEVGMAHTWEVYNGQTRLGSVQAFNAADAITYIQQRLGSEFPLAIAIPIDAE